MLIKFVSNGVSGVPGYWPVGVLVKETIGFIYVVLPIHYYHSYPFICSENYVVPVPFKFP